MKPNVSLLAPALSLALVLCSPAATQWSDDPAVNTPVCTANGQQLIPDITDDGAGGAIIVWADWRSGSSDIYAQRLDIDGNTVWATDGIPVCVTPGTNSGKPKVMNDGVGGAYFAWHDYRSGNADIYLQRVDATGTALWPANGVVACTAANDQYEIELVSDLSGGVLVVWMDLRSGEADLYSQRVDGSGAMLWAADGVPACSAPGVQEVHRSVSDGAGGVIVGWYEDRVDNDDIYMQRLDAAGSPAWTVDGIVVCDAYRYQTGPLLVSDGAGGAITAWSDGRNSSQNRIYAQRVDATGNLLWAPDGVWVSGSEQPGYNPSIVGDGQGGAFIAWGTEYPGTYFDIYAQHLNTSGIKLWVDGGLPVCNAPDDQVQDLIIVEDGTGGFICTFKDWSVYPDDNILGQRLDPDGNRAWDPNGLPVATAPDAQATSRLTANGYGGAILTWSDFRVSLGDIYAQQVNFDGVLGGANPTVSARLTCEPGSGVLPFASGMRVTMDNLYPGQIRRFAAAIDVALASGANYGNWQTGFTNVVAGESFVTAWFQNIPALASLVGSNVFTLEAVDVTPAPYNQPPYPVAGDADSAACIIEGIAP